MTGDCGSFRFPAPVTGVKAASKKNKGIQGLEFYYADKVAKVGDMDGWKAVFLHQLESFRNQITNIVLVLL